MRFSFRNILMIIIIVFTGIFAGCKKHHKENIEPETDTDTDPDGENSVDFLSQDIEIFFSSGKFKPSESGIFCGVSDIDSTQKGIWIITFNGNTCNTKRKREGSIIIQLLRGETWEEKNSIISINFKNYKVTDLNNGKVIEMNGIQKITNETGGSIASLKENQLIHNIRTSNLIYYYNDLPKIVNEAKTRKYIKIGNDFIIENSGDTTINGYPYVAEWGNTVRLIPYHISFLEPVIANTCGGKTKFISGRKFSKTNSSGITTIYGINKDGELINDCSAWGYKSTWTDKSGEVRKKLIKY